MSIMCNKYGQNMQIYRLYESNIPKICTENMQKYSVLYANYAEVYILRILHLHALGLTFLTSGFLAAPGT